MGIYDSSKYRVKPLMEFIGNDTQKIEQLLHMVCLDSHPLIQNISIGNIIEIAFKNDAKKEKRLPPLPEHINAMKDLNENNEFKKTPPLKSIFEGKTSPDIFIETDKYIIVIEAKWTEKRTTKSTTYLENRDQLIRHIEGAINYNSEKDVIAFYIVDTDFVNVGKIGEGNRFDLSRDGFIETLDREDVCKKGVLLSKIQSAYKGYTTWQEMENLFGKNNLSFKTKEEIKTLTNSNM